MSVALLLIGDGRDEYRDRTVASAAEHLPKLDHLVEIDDRDHELGFGGAIQAGWEQVISSGADWVFHLELDFLFTAAVPVDRMIAVLQRRPYLTQVALKRQPVNDTEVAAGGIVEQDPDAYRQRVDQGDVWTEHRKCLFTTNPSVYPAAMCWLGWPDGPESEGHFGLRLAEDPEAHSAFWGSKFDRPLVQHIGDERIGKGY